MMVAFHLCERVAVPVIEEGSPEETIALRSFYLAQDYQLSVTRENRVLGALAVVGAILGLVALAWALGGAA